MGSWFLCFLHPRQTSDHCEAQIQCPTEITLLLRLQQDGGNTEPCLNGQQVFLVSQWKEGTICSVSH